MNYLLTKDSTGQDCYYRLSTGEDRKIEALFKMNPIPKSFLLKDGSTIVTDEVIGFSGDKPKVDLGIRSMDDLRTWVTKQKWYRHSLKETEAQPLNEPEPIAV